jgi:hypothetical protein
MELSTAEKFILLVHHPAKARYLVAEQKRNAGIAGAMLLDLTLDKKIEIVDHRIRVRSHTTKISPAHILVLRKLTDSGREKKARSWISNLTLRGGKYRRILIENMQKKRILKLERKRFLFIPYIKTRLLNPKKHAELVKQIRSVILEKQQIDNEMSAILSLIDGTKTYRIISKERSELKAIKSRLKDVLKDDVISRDVDKVIKEMQAAVAIAVSTAVVASSASSGS